MGFNSGFKGLNTAHFDFCGPCCSFCRKSTYCYCKTNWENYRRIC